MAERIQFTFLSIIVVFVFVDYRFICFIEGMGNTPFSISKNKRCGDSPIPDFFKTKRIKGGR
jgi:hypothetical protein